MLNKKMLKQALRIGFVSAALSMSFVSGANASIAVDVVRLGGGLQITNPPFTIGWRFGLANSATIDALGVWDAGSNGLNESHPVGLWTSAGALVATTTVSNASPDVVASVSGEGRWMFEPIAALLLGAGDYVVGAFSGNDPFATYVDTIAVDPLISSFSSGAFEFGGSLQFPTQTEGSANSLFGPNLRFAGNAIPEPSALALLGLAVALLAVPRRRRGGKPKEA